MKRSQLGDVFAFKTDRGYRIMHWVYRIEKMGYFVKVFPGFYNEIPENIEEIIEGEYSYMINADARRLYNKGIFEHIGNYPGRDQIPFPTHDIEFRRYVGNTILYRVAQFTCHQNDEQFIGDATGKCIPERYGHIKLLNGIPHPIRFLYLLASDFDLRHIELFWATDEELNRFDQLYGDIIFGKNKT
jgi:hypothetical protein